MVVGETTGCGQPCQPPVASPSEPDGQAFRGLPDPGPSGGYPQLQPAFLPDFHIDRQGAQHFGRHLGVRKLIRVENLEEQRVFPGHRGLPATASR